MEQSQIVVGDVITMFGGVRSRSCQENITYTEHVPIAMQLTAPINNGSIFSEYKLTAPPNLSIGLASVAASTHHCSLAIPHNPRLLSGGGGGIMSDACGHTHGGINSGDSFAGKLKGFESPNNMSMSATLLRCGDNGLAWRYL